MLTPARKANSRWRGSPGDIGSIGWPSGRMAQAPARSFEVMMIGDTPSPPRAGRDAASYEAASRPARGGDGVSPIIITSNDLAGAWAMRPDGQPMLPMSPGEPRQREFAFRAGVNIVMYTLTGNYKADQVHAPALIERLGQ